MRTYRNLILTFVSFVLYCNYSLSQPITQEICLVTVDLAIEKNVVVWEKTAGLGIKGYKIYKEDTGGIYDSIAYIPFDSLSIFVDYASNPDVKSDRYYMTAIDSNDIESTPGTPHKTIRFWVQLDSNNLPVLNWENYEGFFYPRYRIWRGTSPGNVAIFDSVGWSTTTYNDTMQGDTLYYLGDVVRFAPCSATVKLKTYNASKSNTATLITTPPVPLSATVTIGDVLCYGGNDGVATVNPAGGSPSYTYSWNDSLAQTTQTATGLSAGIYQVIVIDANNDTVTLNATISEPLEIMISALVTDANAPANNDGTVDISVSGGVVPYSFNWSNGENTEDIDSLAAGMYIVIVTDSNNCTMPDTFIVNLFVSATGTTKNAGVTTFPNPATSFLYVHGFYSGVKNNFMQFNIYNIFAAKIYSELMILNAAPYKVYLNNFPAGVYFYELIDDSAVLSKGKLLIR